MRANLRFKATMASNLRDSVVTVNNGGSISVRYRFLCKIAMLVPVGGQGFIKDSIFIDHVRSGVLTAGSDAQADDCLSDISAPVDNLACADIKVRFFYSLEDQPSEEQEEDHGFIAQRRGNKFEWADRGAKQEVSDCERFLTRKFVSPDDQLRNEARAIKAQSEHLVETIGLNPEKKAAAALSAEILDFGESIKNSKPKEPDMEKDGFMAAPNYQKEFLEWGKTKRKFFMPDLIPE